MRDGGEPPLLEVDIARKRHRVIGRPDLEVIDGLRFSLRRGAVTCLVGPSGCGKTTALRILLGLDKAFDGTIEPPVSQLRLGVVFQDPRLLPWRSVEENVKIAARGIEADTLADLFERLGLAAWRRHRPGELSVGMARRVAVARALAVSPDLLVMDEAFVSLDERGADALRATVFDLARARGITILTVTHALREALRYSDTILVMAPRPTHVLARIDLDTDSVLRDDAWIEAKRFHLMTTNPILSP